MSVRRAWERYPWYVWLAIYGAVLAVSNLWYAFTPEDSSWGVPLVVTGLVAAGVGLAFARAAGVRARRSAEDPALAKGHE